MPAPRLSVQLYSLRNEAAADFPAVLARLGEIGFAGVELAGLHGLTPAEFAAIADASGLVASSGHLGSTEPDAVARGLDELAEAGSTTAVVAFVPPNGFADADAVARTADAINAAAASAASRGMRLGYHNHWWEFETLIGGRTAWDLLWDALDPTIITELDVYWATVGGASPQAAIDRLGERVRYLHVKDGPGDDPAADMVAVGTGSLDIPAIVTSAPHAEWHVVELDRCGTDMMTAIAASHGYLTSSGLSIGAAR